METVNILHRGYKRTLQYVKKQFRGNLWRSDKRYTRVKINGPSLVRGKIAITMYDL